jgi:hypothetical protein
MINESHLRAYVQRWAIAHSYDWHRLTVADIVAELEQDATFQAISLGRGLLSPDGALITKIVLAALPFPARAAGGVLAEAIKIAATMRTATARLWTLAGGVVAAAALYAVLSG